MVAGRQDLGADDLTLAGTSAPAADDAGLAGARARGPVRHVLASVGDGLEQFAETLAQVVDAAIANPWMGAT